MPRLLLGLTLIALVWVIGFVAFIRQLPQPSADALIKGDGVVVYTGGGGARISAGMEILAGGAGKRLLISGVNPDTSRARLSDLWIGAPELFDCCVDLGREALTTEGNAEEANAWAEAHNYKSIVLVTSDYHMPRAVAETKARMPAATLTPYAVASGYLDRRGRPTSFEAWRKLAGEYSKFLLARIKAFFSAPGH